MTDQAKTKLNNEVARMLKLNPGKDDIVYAVEERAQPAEEGDSEQENAKEEQAEGEKAESHFTATVTLTDTLLRVQDKPDGLAKLESLSFIGEECGNKADAEISAARKALLALREPSIPPP